MWGQEGNRGFINSYLVVSSHLCSITFSHTGETFRQVWNLGQLKLLLRNKSGLYPTKVNLPSEQTTYAKESRTRETGIIYVMAPYHISMLGARTGIVDTPVRTLEPVACSVSTALCKCPLVPTSFAISDTSHHPCLYTFQCLHHCLLQTQKFGPALSLIVFP